MSVIELGVICTLIASVGYQVWALRQDGERHHFQILQARERSELDDELRRMCPNICDALSIGDLRQWQAVHLRRHRYYIDRRDAVLIDPISDEPGDWSSIFFMYVPLSSQDKDTDYPFPTPANEEEQEHLRAAKEVTEAFIASAKTQTLLSQAEVNFVTYWEWRQHLMKRDGSWDRPSALTPSLIAVGLKRYSEGYARPVA